MELISTSWHVFSALQIFVLGVFLALTISCGFDVGNKRGLFLNFRHTLWCLVYLAYVVNIGGDSLIYYHESASGKLVSFRVGTIHRLRDRSAESVDWHIRSA